MTVTLSPTSLSLTTPGFKSTTATFTVLNGGSTSVTLSFGAGSSTDFTFSPTSVDPSTTATTVTVTYRPTAATASGSILVTATGSTTPLAGVTLSGTGTNPLTVTGNAYGTTSPGGSVLGLVLVQNAADTAATVSGPTTPFVLNAAYDSVLGGGVVAVPITFAPTDPGDWSQTVTVTVGPWSATATISGTCVPITQVDSSPPPSSAPASAQGRTYQSYYISVPTPASSLNLGYRRASTQKVDGLGVDTVGNAYVRVSEDIGIRADGTDSNIGVQATKDMNFVAGGDVFVGATGATWLVGSGGISIATFANSATYDSGTLMPTDDGITSAKTKINIASATFITLDVLVGLAALGISTRCEVTSAKMFGETLYGGWLAKGSKFASIASALSAVGLDIVAALAATEGTPSSPGVTIYGQAGILAGTPGFASYYAGAGLVMGSIYPTMIGMDTSVIAMKDLSLVATREAAFSAGSATVHGTEEVKIESVEKIGLRTKKATDAGTIEITPDSIEMTSAKGAITSKVELTSTELTVTLTDAIELDAGDTGSIVLKAGGWELKISAAGLEFQKATGGAAAPALKVASSTATLQASATSALKLTATDATMQMGAASFKASASGVETKGPLQNLG